MFLVGQLCSEETALKSGRIVLYISLSYKRKVPVTCMKNILSPFESGGGSSMDLAYCIFAT